MSERCPSCGESYKNHLGMVGTCYRLQEAIGVVGELETKIDRLTAELAECKRIAAEKTVERARLADELAEAREEMHNQIYKASRDVSHHQAIANKYEDRYFKTLQRAEQAEKELEGYKKWWKSEEDWYQLEKERDRYLEALEKILGPMGHDYGLTQQIAREALEG